MHDDRSSFGAVPLDRTLTAFRWAAPTVRQAVLETDSGGRHALAADPDGVLEAVLPLPAGTGYRYLAGGVDRPVVDPAARALRGGFAVVVDPSTFAWRHDDWRGRPWHEAVVCELDLRARGGFDAAAGRLPAIAAIGVTALLIAPAAPGFAFAPDPALGDADGVRRLVDTAHGLGMTVLLGGLDVAGAGDAFRVACAVQWLADHRVDGLRVPAAGLPDGFAAAVRAAAGPHRRVHLIVDGGDGPLPDGFDARWTAGADAPPAAGPVTTTVRPLPGDDAAGLVRGLLSPAIPAFADRLAFAAGDDAQRLSRLLRLRAERLVPQLAGARRLGAEAPGPQTRIETWQLGDGARLVVASHAGAEPLAWPGAPPASHRLASTGVDGPDLPAASTRVYLVPGLPDDLAELAARAGVAREWTDQGGQVHTVARETVERILQALGLPCDSPTAIVTSIAALRAAQAAPAMLTARVGEPLALPLPPGLAAGRLRATLTLESGESRGLLAGVREADEPGAAPMLSFDGLDVPGYHRLVLASGGATHALVVAVAPQRAFDPGLERAWGTSVQLYALRPPAGHAAPDAGFGDFGALAAFAAHAGAAGADLVAISPTHAGFAADASHFSPYAPSSRLFHNVLFVDPVAAVGVEAALAAAAEAGLEFAASSDDTLVDWPTAAARKLRWLRAVFDRLPAAPPDRVDEGLRLHATFEALHAHFAAAGRPDWRQWPAAFQDPGSDAVAAFAEAHADDIRFHVRLQRWADDGLDRAQAAARAAGMRVGLVADLAIGMSGAGSHAWASRSDLLGGLEIGAPPDPMNPRGQRWGLTGFAPRALAERCFEPFLHTLRAAMRRAGGVRIDHVLGLNRLWLVPDGLPATDGAYLHYPLRDFVNLLILESHRERAVVIGEDLGTVPEGLRETLANAGVLGMAVLWLERAGDGTGFTPPHAWSRNAVAMTTTHDLPTAAGWWQGRDIDWRERVGTEPDAAGARRRRDAERAALAALVPGDAPDDGGVDLAIAVVAHAPGALVIVPIEDLLGLVEQPNLPGTVDEHPNWRRRLPVGADALFDADAVRRRIALLRDRPGG